MAVITQDKITLQSAKAINDKAEAAQTLAGNTNQHFWFSSSGTDTGAHITEVTQEDFTDPQSASYQSGGNLLARSNGIAVRDGMTELASFSATSAVIGSLAASHIVTSTSNIELFDDYGASIAEFGQYTRIGKGTGYNMRISGTNIVGRNVSDIIGSIEMYRVTNGDSLDVYTGNNDAYLKLSGDDADTAPELSLGVTFNGGQNVHDITIDNLGILFSGANRVLWQPTSQSASPYLTDTQPITLSEAVSRQLTGIVLVWSRRASGTVYNDSWWYEYIPKWHAMNHGTQGIYMSTPTGFSATVCIKYVYIDDLEITGHASNSATGTGYANNTRVLRAVIGV